MDSTSLFLFKLLIVSSKFFMKIVIVKWFTVTLKIKIMHNLQLIQVI